MYKKLPADILTHARALRGTQTDAENLVWMLLRDRRMVGFKFRRQHPVGKYIIDFYCHEAKLAIELDGGGHNLDYSKEYDRLRSLEIENTGIYVVRFWNNEVFKDCEAVMECIYRLLQERTEKASLTPAPLPEGEGIESSESSESSVTSVAKGF
jgi:very-short-patch-repair endonuclease